MNRQLYTDIAALHVCGEFPKPIRGLDTQACPSIQNAWILIEGDTILDYGSMSELPGVGNATIQSLKGSHVLPAFIDSHTHTVFAKTREQEFLDRIHGLSYEQIAERGGGINHSAKALQEMDADQLYDQAYSRCIHMIAQGTGAIEIKSGYGLTVDAERKMLEVIQRLKINIPIPIKATFLGAHTIPTPFIKNRTDYIDLIVERMIPEFTSLGLMDYVDVFCESKFIQLNETERILKAGATYGVRGKIHVNQFNCLGGIALANRYHALSVDHLEVVNTEDIQVLSHSDLIATLLPTAPFFLNQDFPPSKELLENHAIVALATDFNPGTAPCDNMFWTFALACIRMRMTPEQAMIACTINAAFALEIESYYGSITRGKKANLIITKPGHSPTHFAYQFNEGHIEKMLINGTIFSNK